MLTDLVQLRTFVAVAEEQHLTRAAERLHLSQSAASAHIRSLEDRLGLQLFVRTNRSLELTRAGRDLSLKARAMLNEEALFASYARQLRGKIEGRIVVASTSEPGTKLGQIVFRLRELHPLITVDLLSRTSTGTRQALIAGEADIGLLLGPPINAAFTHFQLMLVPYRVAGPAAWSDAIETAGLAELAALPWLTPSSSNAYSGMLGQMFGSKGLDLNSVMTFDNSAVGRAALQAGVGMMLLREEHALQGEREGYLAVSPIARSDVMLSVAVQAGRADDPLIKAFLEAAGGCWPDIQMLAKQGG